MSPYQSTPLSTAPMGVLRVAALPLESLEGFGSDKLRDLAAADPATGEIGQEFNVTYENVMEAELKTLWSRTGGDAHFLKRLRLSRPGMVEVCLAVDGRDRAGKGTRSLMRSLFRFLARTAGRATPGGPWAGVAPIEFGAETRIQSAPQRLVFVPNLAPFAELFSRLDTRAPYLGREPRWRNPTIRLEQDRLTAVTPHSPGRTTSQQTDFRHWKLLKTLPDDKTVPLEEIRGTLDEEEVAIWRHLIARGFVLGGLLFPTRFASVREALALAAGRLTPQHATAWRLCAAELDAMCSALTQDYDTLSVSDLNTRLEDAKASVERLGEALGASFSLAHDQNAIWCDLMAPFRLVLGVADKARLMTGLNAYENWMRHHSPSAAARHRFRRSPRHLGPLSHSGRPSAASEWENAWEDGTAKNRLVRLAAFLRQPGALRLGETAYGEPVAARATDSLPPTAPLCCAHVELWPGVVTLYGIADHPTFGYGRALTLLPELASLRSWLADEIERFARESGLRVIELDRPYPVPNLLLRPDLPVPPMDPWRPDHHRLPLSPHRVTGEPVVENGVVFDLTAAERSAHDPLVGRLLLTGFQERPNATFRGLAAALSASSVRTFGPIHLTDGVLVAPRTHVVPQSALGSLAGGDGRRRFLMWQRLAREGGWPHLIRAAVDGEPPLLVPRDSPLAVEALFRDRREIRELVITEVPRRGLLAGPEGTSHVAEAIFPLARREHAFSPCSPTPEGEER